MNRLQVRSTLTSALVVGSIAAISASAGPIQNFVSNGEFTNNADGWTLINHASANWQGTPGWDGNPGWFFVNDADGPVPETSQLVVGLVASVSYTVSGYYIRQTENFSDPGFQVLIDNVVFFSAGGTVANGWTFFSFKYVAVDSDALLQFRAQVSGDDAYGIDNIRMTPPPVPAPGAFDLLSPPDGFVRLSTPEIMNWPGSTNSAPASWSASTNSDTYTFTISLDPALMSVVFQQSGLTTTTFNIPVGAIQGGRRYHWGVTAVNPTGSTPSTTASFTFTTASPADVNGDGVVNAADLAQLLANWGLLP